MPQIDKKNIIRKTTAAELVKRNKAQVKIFLWGSVGLIVVSAVVFITGAVFLLFKPSKSLIEQNVIADKKEPDKTAVEQKNQTAGPDLLVTKAPERQKITYPSITFIDPQLGPANAPITIIEFSDFNCPYCANVQTTLDELFIKYPNQIRLVWKSLPIKQLHPTAQLAAEAALCAGEQNKFWEYHNLLFANQDYFTSNVLISFAKQLNLDIKNFSSCVKSGKMSPRVKKTVQEAKDLLINSTPHFYINRQEIFGAADLEDFVKIIDVELNK